MKKLLFIFCFLFSTIADAQQRTPIGTTNGYTHMQGATQCDTVLAIPIRDTVNWNYTTFRKLGRMTVRPQDGKIYYHNLLKWVKIIDASDNLSGVDSNVYATVTRLQDSLKNYLRESDSFLYVTTTALQQSAVDIKNWTAAQGYLTAEVDGSVTNELQNLSSTRAGNNITINITNGTGIVVNVADGDSVTGNELQNLSFNSGTNELSISQGNSITLPYLQSFTETDPTVPSFVKSITNTDISNWNSAYGWGNHAGAGYLTSAAAATTYVSLSGSYTNPGWIVSIPWSKITSTPTTRAGYGITDAEGTITAGTTGQYWRGDKTWQTLNGSAVGLGNVENTALSTWAGSSNITTLGTIATGTWNATQISVSKGGTGLTTLGSSNQLLGVNSGGSALEYKSFAVGTTGTDFAIAHTANTVTFNLPSASATARGVVTTGTQTFAGSKTFSSSLTIGTGTWGLGGGSRANNIVIGVGAGAGTMTTGSTTPNIFIGAGAGAVVTGGYSHIYAGYRAGFNQTGGDDNIGIGYRALFTSGDTYFNIAIGTDAGYNITNSAVGLYNTIVGHNGGRNIGAGQRNCAYGFYSLGLSASSGGISYNCAYGQATLANLISGNNNLAVGANALFTTTSSSNQIGVGYQAGYYNTGNGNAFFGGYDANDRTTVSNHIFLADGDGNLGVWFNSTKAATFTSTIKTAQPSANGAGAIKIGKVITGASVTVQTDKYLEVEIDGTIYKLAIVQ